MKRIKLAIQTLHGIRPAIFGGIRTEAVPVTIIKLQHKDTLVISFPQENYCDQESLEKAKRNFKTEANIPTGINVVFIYGKPTFNVIRQEVPPLRKFSTIADE